MSEEPALEAEAVEIEDLGVEASAAEPVRRLPVSSTRRELEPISEVRAAALVAAGGVVAGAATVVAVRAVKSARAARAGRRQRVVRREAARVLASRSFLVDVHLLGR